MSFRTRIAARLLIVLALWSTPSCLLVEYSDSLVDERVRSNFVTQPASIGGILGFIVGVPFDVLEFIFYRAWRRPPAQELPDLEIDDPGSDRERRRPEAARSR